jgi:hypothetical protein
VRPVYQVRLMNADETIINENILIVF